jgi:hypothetical protein
MFRANPARPARRMADPLENESQASASNEVSSSSMSDGAAVCCRYGRWLERARRVGGAAPSRGVKRLRRMASPSDDASVPGRDGPRSDPAVDGASPPPAVRSSKFELRARARPVPIQAVQAMLFTTAAPGAASAR